MVNRTHESRKLTYRVALPGGQERLRELILYVATQSTAMEWFGLIKVNKIIWRADFTAFAARGVPVTGRAYQRLPLGPALVEMRPLLAEMQQDDLIVLTESKFGMDQHGARVVERRPVAREKPNLRWFSDDDLSYVNQAISYYWNMSGSETSEDSHGPAWKTREDFDPIPYEASYLVEAEIGPEQLERIFEIAKARGWRSE